MNRLETSVNLYNLKLYDHFYTFVIFVNIRMIVEYIWLYSSVDPFSIFF